MSTRPKIINLITHDNGVGLTQDVRIVQSILSRHDCRFWEVFGTTCDKADINIHFEVLNRKFFQFAPVNLFFPNPEWFWFPEELKRIDIAMAKTRDAERLFNARKCQTVFTSFTSRDMQKPVPKLRKYLHIAGQSRSKGTGAVFASWKPTYPEMVFTKLNNFQKYTIHPDNITTVFERMSDKKMYALMNGYYFHLCPSEYEGFGHYIWEAKSCGAVVITTDAPPMNEFVEDGVDGFTVKPSAHKTMNIARAAIVHYRQLQRVIERTFTLTNAELQTMSLASRTAWEDNDRYFREILPMIIKNV